MIRLALCFWLVAAVAKAADVDPSLCRDIDDTTRNLVPTELRPWFQFEHAVQACPAHDRNRRFLWWIFTINIKFEPSEARNDPLLYPLIPGTFTRRCMPKPFIIDSSGRELGRISDAFPTGGFGHTELVFSQWVAGIPRRITVKVFDGGVRGDYLAPPLQWNGKTQYYDQIGKNICDLPPLFKRGE